MKAHLAIVALLIILSFSPSAIGDHNSMKLILLIENKDYLNGTTGNLTVHVFDKEVHVDSDRDPVVEILGLSVRDVTVSRISTGVYNGTFNVTNEDVVDNFITFKASATEGKTNDMDTIFNSDNCIARIPFMNEFTIGMAIANVSEPRVKAGTRITVQAALTALPEVAFDFQAEYLDPDGRVHSSPIDAIPLGDQPIRPGIYQGKAFEGVYTIPNLAYSANFSLVAHAQYGPANRTASITIPSNFFFIVYHNISNNATDAVFDLYVGKDSGAPLPNAVVKLKWYPDGSVPGRTWTDAGVTNSSGCTRVHITCENGTRLLHLTGKASALGKTQMFEGTIDVPQAGPHLPDGPGFKVTSESEPTIIYGQGQGVFSHDYWAYYDQNAWGNKDVYCYVLSYPVDYGWWNSGPPNHLNGAYALMTDGTGEMTVNSSSTGGNQVLCFKSPTGTSAGGGMANGSNSSIDGLFYSEDIELVVYRGPGQGAGPNGDIYFVGPNGPAKVWMNGIGYAPCDMVTLRFVKEIYGYGDLTENPNWRIWADIPVFMKQDNSHPSAEYCNITYPRFLPKGMSFDFYTREMEFPYGNTYLESSFLAIGPQARPHNEKAGVDYFSSLIPMILLIGMGIVVAVAFKRQKRG